MLTTPLAKGAPSTPLAGPGLLLTRSTYLERAAEVASARSAADGDLRTLYSGPPLRDAPLAPGTRLKYDDAAADAPGLRRGGDTERLDGCWYAAFAAASWRASYCDPAVERIGERMLLYSCGLESPAEGDPPRAAYGLRADGLGAYADGPAYREGLAPRRDGESTPCPPEEYGLLAGLLP